MKRRILAAVLAAALCLGALGALTTPAEAAAADVPQWIYAGLSGKGWIKYGGEWYYYRSGRIVSDDWAPDGPYWCWMGGDGLAIRNTWKYIQGDWYYFDGDGHAVCNDWVRDGYGWCWMDGGGRAARDRWLQLDDWYYFDGNGHAATNRWVRDGRYWCWMDGDGHPVRDRWLQLDDGWYYFDEDGHAVTNTFVPYYDTMIWLGEDGRADCPSGIFGDMSRQTDDDVIEYFR